MPNYTECVALMTEGVVAKPDSDISGPGVIYAFIVSGCLTLVAIAAAYVSGLVDAGLLGPVDRIVLRIPTRSHQHPRIHVALRKAIMACSDQQIVTGIAILGAGFNRLQHGDISVYHFHIIIYLAWMSSSVHLSALTILKAFMQQHRGVLVWRCVGMLVLFVMMIIALVPTVSNDWAVLSLSDLDPNDPNYIPGGKTAFGIPAICYWGQLYGDGPNPDAILSYIVLSVSYLWKMGGLFAPVNTFWQRNIRNPLDYCLEAPLSFFARRYAKRASLVSLLLYWLWLAVYLQLTAILEVLNSFSAALWLSTLGVIYGIMQIGIPRELMQQAVPSLADGENQWNFGQLVPLVLLVQPVGAITEHLWLIGKDDEEPYIEDDSVMHNSVMRYFGQGASLPPPRNVSLLQYAAKYTVPKATETSADRIKLHAVLYLSKLFKFIIWAVHLAVAATAGFLFYIDYLTIGFETASNWTWILAGIGGYMVTALLVILVIGPFSHLGRASRKPDLAVDVLPSVIQHHATPLELISAASSWDVSAAASCDVKGLLPSGTDVERKPSARRRSWHDSQAK